MKGERGAEESKNQAKSEKRKAKTESGKRREKGMIRAGEKLFPPGE